MGARKDTFRKILHYIRRYWFFVALSLLLNHTKLGVSIRAVASNREAAQLCGIDLSKPS